MSPHRLRLLRERLPEPFALYRRGGFAATGSGGNFDGREAVKADTDAGTGVAGAARASKGVQRRPRDGLRA